MARVEVLDILQFGFQQYWRFGVRDTRFDGFGVV
jgi:hypothetical protein